MEDFLKKLMALADELNGAEDGFHQLLIVDEMKRLYSQHIQEVIRAEKIKSHE